MRETMLLIQSIVPGRTIGSPARRSGAAFYVARGAFLVQGHCEWGRTPWENVPGALSSHGGKDFEIVLNELLHLRDFAGGGTDKPIRQHGRWAKRASYGTVAYRIVNAQYWGIPHRRRRIYAVCDTRGESATMVAFERNGTEWHFRPRLPEGGQTVACLAPDCYSWHDRMVAAGKPLRGGRTSLHLENSPRM